MWSHKIISLHPAHIKFTQPGGPPTLFRSRARTHNVQKWINGRIDGAIYEKRCQCTFHILDNLLYKRFRCNFCFIFRYFIMQ